MHRDQFIKRASLRVALAGIELERNILASSQIHVSLVSVRTKKFSYNWHIGKLHIFSLEKLF